MRDRLFRKGLRYILQFKIGRFEFILTPITAYLTCFLNRACPLNHTPQNAFALQGSGFRHSLFSFTGVQEKELKQKCLNPSRKKNVRDYQR